jgi:hypothetical protein
VRGEPVAVSFCHLSRSDDIIYQMSKHRLPIEVKNALIKACSRSFWYKQPLFEIFDRADIPENLYIKYEHEIIVKIARLLIEDLENMGEEGYLLQRSLLTEFCKLHSILDKKAPGYNDALDALHVLKSLAQEHDLIIKEERKNSFVQVANVEHQVQQARDRERRLKELYGVFGKMSLSYDSQTRGYDLEDLVKELFNLFELRYRKSYRTECEQIDGFFSFGGFDYLVECRWRKDVPSLDALLAFKGKVDRKIESTRGLFISVAGFRDDVVQRLRESGPANLILMDGYDLVLILEGRVNLIDALQAKTDKASQEGLIFFPVVNLFKII